MWQHTNQHFPLVSSHGLDQIFIILSEKEKAPTPTTIIGVNGTLFIDFKY